MPIPWYLPIDEIADLLYSHLEHNEGLDMADDAPRLMAEALRQIADELEGYPLEATFARWDLENDLKLLAKHPNELIASQVERAAKKRYSHLLEQECPSEPAGCSETRNSHSPVPKAT